MVRLLRHIPRLSKIAVKKLQQLGGKLQHASFGIPGDKIIFTLIVMALIKASNVIIINPLLKQTLVDWGILIQYTAYHLTSIIQLVQQSPT